MDVAPQTPTRESKGEGGDAEESEIRKLMTQGGNVEMLVNEDWKSRFVVFNETLGAFEYRKTADPSTALGIITVRKFQVASARIERMCSLFMAPQRLYVSALPSRKR